MDDLGEYRRRSPSLRDLREAICEDGVVHSHGGKQTLNDFGGDSRSLICFFL